MAGNKYNVDSVGPRMDEFLRPLLKRAGFNLDFELAEGHSVHPEYESPEVVIQFKGADVDLLLANKAELLLALEQVTMEALRMPSEDHSRISFDANDYRMLRIEELRLSATAAAEKVKRTGAPFFFNPMNSRERRVIHMALRGETELRSESGGFGSHRLVVVYPAGMPSVPPPPPPPPPRREPEGERSRPPLRPAVQTSRPRREKIRTQDTIVAISTPPGRAGIGVVRLSGGDARAIAERILKFPQSHQWRTWGAALAELADVDRVVVSFFEGPRSYTAEDVVEISCHGSPVVLRHCLERAVGAGARLAEPGEFTLRAYLNGRIDLPRAEAVRDLIESTTLYQARVAAQQVEGSVSRRLAPLKEALLELISLLEAGIDFAEDDISIAPDREILRRLEPVRHGVSCLADSFAFGKLVHSGLTLAIVGRPNVGKSSLFNRLLEQDRAIVTDIPGTTRDLVSEVAAINGIPVKLIDTAGIREGEGLIENLGIERSLQAMADADVTLVVVDLSAPVEEQDRKLMARAKLIVGNKSDLPRRADISERLIAVSALTGDGIDALRAAIVPQVDQESGFITSLRHEQLLRESLEYLDRGGIAVREHIPHEMLLLDLYSALRPIDAITGATTADDILNRIFSTFCIGK